MGQSYLLPGEQGAVIPVPIYTPGLPEGYNPSTGTISGDTTGATQAPSVSQNTLNAALDLVPSTYSDEAVQMELANADAYLQQNAITNCPSGYTCSFINGIPDIFIYAAGSVALLFMFAIVMGGGRKR